MPKSNFPNKIDTSIEIPAVRDNIIEVGSDVINSLRSAIFQIEKTLGVNPQGAAGNTVSERIDRALDGNGNIRKEALDAANQIAGPISNSDVSKAAAIEESKLKLNFPTNLLQDEISIISSKLDDFISSLEELSLKLSMHIHPDAIDRHKAKAISVEKIDSTKSSTSKNSTEGGTLQTVLEEIYGTHINYDGLNTSEENNSHSASQIYFNNENILDIIDASNVQDAIDEMGQLYGEVSAEHQNIFHQNGILKSIIETSVSNPLDDIIIIESIKVNFSKPLLSNTFRSFDIYFETPVLKSSLSISKSDIAEISDTDLLIKFQISELIIDGENLLGFKVFGNINIDSSPSATVTVYKNRNQPAGLSALLLGVRPDAGHTSAEVLQVADPRSASIISSGLRPLGINSENRFLDLSIDASSSITIDLYDEDFKYQTADTIINKINVQLVSGAHPALAYRVEMPYGGVEIAIVHNIPSTREKNYSLKISKSSDDGIIASGFGYADGVDIFSSSGNSFYIQGRKKDFIKTTMTRDDLSATDGTNFIESSELSILNNEVLNNNLVNVFKEGEVKTYKVSSISDLKMTVDIEQLKDGFSGSSDITKFEVYNNTVSFKNQTFDEINSQFASGIFDIFIDSNCKVFSNKRLSYQSAYSFDAVSLLSIVDFSGEIAEGLKLSAKIVDEKTIKLSLGNNSHLKISRFSGPGIFREMRVGAFWIKIYIDSFSRLHEYIDSANNEPNSGYIEIDINLFSDINREENLYIGRIHYESSVGRISGAGTNTPRVKQDQDKGTTGFKDLSSGAIYKAIYEPISELRSNGVISGLEVEVASDGLYVDDSIFKLKINDGICYVGGRRFEIIGENDFTTGINAINVDKFYIAIDSLGSIVFSPADSVNCDLSLDVASHCVLAVAEWDGVELKFYDLRLFLDNIDLKILNSITVSPYPGMGHFSHIGSALKYAKRFSEAFPGAGTPSIHLKSGHHMIEVDLGVPFLDLTESILIEAYYREGLWINFPINITGEGETTVLEIFNKFEDLNVDYRNDLDGANGLEGKVQTGSLIVAGAGMSRERLPSGSSDVLDNGFVCFRDFKLKSSRVTMSDFLATIADKNNPGEFYGLNCGVKFDKIIFDFSSHQVNAYARAYEMGPGVFQLSGKDPLLTHGIQLLVEDVELTDSPNMGGAEYIGNLYVSNCEFINSYILASENPPEGFKNITIRDNTIRGSGDGRYQTELSGFIEIGENGRSIIDPVNSRLRFNNINISGNAFFGSTLAAFNAVGIVGAAQIDDLTPFSLDRVNGDLVTGGNVGIQCANPDNLLVVGSGGSESIAGGSFVHGNPAIEIKLHAGANVVGGLMITDELGAQRGNQHNTKFHIGYNALTNVSFWSSCHVMEDQVRAEIEMTPAGEVNFYSDVWFRKSPNFPKGIKLYGRNGNIITEDSMANQFRGRTEFDNPHGGAAGGLVTFKDGVLTKFEDGTQVRFESGTDVRFQLDSEVRFETNNVSFTALPADVGTTLIVNGSNKICRLASTKKIKKDIDNSKMGLEDVLKLRPVTYSLKADQSSRQLGFIAEDLHEISPLLSIVGKDYNVKEDGQFDYNSLASDELVPVDWDTRAVISMLVGAIKDLNKKIKDLEEKIDA